MMIKLSIGQNSLGQLLPDQYRTCRSAVDRARLDGRTKFKSFPFEFGESNLFGSGPVIVPGDVDMNLQLPSIENV